MLYNVLILWLLTRDVEPWLPLLAKDLCAVALSVAHTPATCPQIAQGEKISSLLSGCASCPICATLLISVEL